jgi:flagellar motor switch protein FliN/FliY
MGRTVIQYLKLEESEKVIEALASCMEEGFAKAIGEKAAGPVRVSCPRVEKTDLKTVLGSFPSSANAVEIRYKDVLSGSALILIAMADLCSLAEITSGAMAPAAGTMVPEVMEACVKYFSHAMAICNGQFFTQQNQKIESEDPELINPDGSLTSLAPLADLYNGVLCLTFEIAAASKLECKMRILIQPDLKESLMFLLPNYVPVAQSPNMAEEGVLQDNESSNPKPEITESLPPTLSKSGASSPPSANWNIDLLLDVELPIVVSFGEAEMLLKDVLKLGVGSVIELDKSVNDPVTIIVNQKPIARGEVVMVDGNYGVRILEVESTADRIKSLG